MPVIGSASFGAPLDRVLHADVHERRERGGDLGPGQDHVCGGGDGEVAGICEAGVSARIMKLIRVYVLEWRKVGFPGPTAKVSDAGLTCCHSICEQSTSAGLPRPASHS